MPFLFYTGLLKADVLKVWPEVPVLRKPAHDHEIIAYIVELTT